LVRLNRNQIKQIVLNRKASLYAKEYLNKRGDNLSPLLINYRGRKDAGKRLTRRSVERIAKKYGEEINFPLPITPESLRWARIRALMHQQEHKPEIIQTPFSHKSIVCTSYNYKNDKGSLKGKSIQKRSFPWHDIEKNINNEIKWLKNNIFVLPKEFKGRPLSLNDDYFLRKIAILIVSGRIKAKEIRTKKLDMFGSLTKKENVQKISRHGRQWHKKMMDAVHEYFKSQGYRVVLEPILDYGRADLGIYQNHHNPLYIEVGTTSLFKTWYNLSIMKDIALLFIPHENYALEFKT